METLLHQQLKLHYAPTSTDCEQQVGRFRVDVLQANEIIEIQCSSLAALRDKVRELTPLHQLRIVKPLTRHTFVIRKRWSRTISQGLASNAGDWCDLFEELVHFVTVFPRPNLTLEAVLIDIEETRRPPRNRSQRGYRVEERQLTAIVGSCSLVSAEDLYRLLPPDLPEQFQTDQLARLLNRPRWFAQKVAYCLRETAAAVVIGKQGNSLVYQRAGHSPEPRAYAG